MVSSSSPPSSVLGPAQWLPESCFSFSSEDLSSAGAPPGWIYQQLLKLFPDMIVEREITFAGTCQAALVGEVLTVSHRWMQAHEPEYSLWGANSDLPRALCLG